MGERLGSGRGYLGCADHLLGVLRERVGEWAPSSTLLCTGKSSPDPERSLWAPSPGEEGSMQAAVIGWPGSRGTGAPDCCLSRNRIPLPAK